jgi:hypothetical protein
VATVPHEVAVELGRASGESRRRRSKAIKRLVAETRRQQGLPPTVEDNAVLEQLAAILENGGGHG